MPVCARPGASELLPIATNTRQATAPAALSYIYVRKGRVYVRNGYRAYDHQHLGHSLEEKGKGCVR